MISLIWQKYSNNSWPELTTLDLSQSHFNNLIGIYIIWHGGNNPWTVRVGQGIIRDRVSEHTKDPLILIYKNLGLYVTWAQLDQSLLDGVERYIAEQLKPKIGNKFPMVAFIPVNLPW